VATDGITFSRWLSQAEISEQKLTPDQLALLRGAWSVRLRRGDDYYTRRIVGHFLLNSASGLQVSQIARLVGFSRPTASKQQSISSKQAVQDAHRRLSGRPHGKLLPRYAGSIAQYLVNHPKASRADVLDFIERTWEVRVSTVALFYYMKKYGLDKAQRSLAAKSEEPPVLTVPAEAVEAPRAVSLPPPGGFFLPIPASRGRSCCFQQR
jgi:hypothetical protein